MNVASLSRRHAFLAFAVYLAFVVYGSLIPFEYRIHTLDQALEKFAAITYLDLGVGSRADWIANIVLYVPLAFLGCVWMLGLRAVSSARYLALIVVLALCLTAAVAVEFVQIFFAPRTVSLNDLLAETLGTLGGVALWAFGRWRIVQLLDAFAEGGRPSVLSVIVAYGLLYLAMSLFPYDFVVSAKELAWKLESGNHGWLIAGVCGDWLRCGARFVGEAVAIAPLGLLIALVAPRLRLLRVFVMGVALGLVLEAVQFFLASGSSQGLSLVLRGGGLAAGAGVGRLLLRRGPLPVARLIWYPTPFVALPYAVILAGLAGWLAGPWLPLSDALERLADVRFMPFYYHYFSTEPRAVASLLAHATMYAPVGLALWARRVATGRPTERGARKAALWAALLAFPIELGKLLVPPKHPDFTDLFIAAGAAGFAYAVAVWSGRVLAGGQPDKPAPRTPAPNTPPVVSRSARPSIDWPEPHFVGVLIGLSALLASLLGLANYPIAVPVVGLALLIYGVSLWRWPLLWFFVISALLPALDLSPVTGRLPLNEFDLVVLVTLAVVYVRVFRLPPWPWPHPLLPLALALLWVTWGVATARGLWPLWSTAGGISASSHSPLEAWFVGKGLLWALLFVPLVRRVPRAALEAVRTRVLNGLVVGLGLVTLAVLWERHIYVGVADFKNVFRVTGTFSSMHTGGAYIEAFIAFAFPALAVWVLLQRSWTLRLLGVAAATLASYAMLVTFSRGGYAGLGAGLLVVAVGTLRLRSGSPTLRWAVLAGLVAAAVAVAIPVLSGGFARYRLERAAEDLSIRRAHWGRALGLMDDGLTAAVAGVGFGRYPTLYLLRADHRVRPGAYEVMRDRGNPYLRLGAGESVYLDQVVDLEPGARYRLSARLRQPYGEASLVVWLCEKALLYSFECVSQRIGPEIPGDGWTPVTVQMVAGNLGRGGNWPHRPVKLSLHNGSRNPIDVDEVSLKREDGRELLANGDFSNGVERWLFVTDQDLAWHIHQQWVEMYFAQGLLGLGAMVALLIGVGAVLWPAVLGGNLQATAFAGALVAFVAVGLLGSTMDTARVSMLFYLGAFCAGLLFCGDEEWTSRRSFGQPLGREDSRLREVSGERGG